MISGHYPGTKPPGGISGIAVFLIVVVTIFISSGASYLLTSALAAPKSEYAADINSLTNDIDHLKSSAASLDSFISFQGNSLQTKLDDIDISLLEINAVQTAADNKINALVTAVNTTNGSITALSGTVNGIGSLQIVPSITTTEMTLADGTKLIDGGSINLAIRSTQTVASRIVAFRVEFRPNEAIGPLGDTFDQALINLYAAIPITLKPGGPSGVAVEPGSVSYNIYYGLGGYHLGSIEFITSGTVITKDTTTKTIAYIFGDSVRGSSFNVLITPLFEAPSTTIDTLAPTW